MTTPTPETPAGGPGCVCPPCPGRGNDGHGLTHCAECCFGTGVVADIDCPIHGETPAGGLTTAEWTDVLATLPESPESADGWELSLVRRTIERILADRAAAVVQARAEADEAWRVAAERRGEGRRYYVAWQVARMRARAERQARAEDRARIEAALAQSRGCGADVVRGLVRAALTATEDGVGT